MNDEIYCLEISFFGVKSLKFTRLFQYLNSLKYSQSNNLRLKRILNKSMYCTHLDKII